MSRDQECVFEKRAQGQPLPLTQDRTLAQPGQSRGQLHVLTVSVNSVTTAHTDLSTSHKPSQGSKNTSLTCLKTQFGYRTQAGLCCLRPPRKKTQTKKKHPENQTTLRHRTVFTIQEPTHFWGKHFTKVGVESISGHLLISFKIIFSSSFNII